MITAGPSFGNSCAVAELDLLDKRGRLQGPWARPPPLGSTAALWKGRQEAGYGEEQSSGNMTEIKGPG